MPNSPVRRAITGIYSFYYLGWKIFYIVSNLGVVETLFEKKINIDFHDVSRIQRHCEAVLHTSCSSTYIFL